MISAGSLYVNIFLKLNCKLSASRIIYYYKSLLVLEQGNTYGTSSEDQRHYAIVIWNGTSGHSSFGHYPLSAAVWVLGILAPDF